MHQIKKRRQLAVVKFLWESRYELGKELDVSPGRLLSDAAISALAMAVTDDALFENKKHLEKVLRPIGLRARWLEHAPRWISAIASARALAEDDLPPVRAASDALPPVKVWREKYPLRYAALTHARHNLSLRAEELSIPLENMISPEHVRRICWNSPTGNVDQALTELGARPWQREIAVTILESALLEREPLEPVEISQPDEPGQEEPSEEKSI
jgi:ribonuclease D